MLFKLNLLSIRLGAFVDKENSALDFDSWPPVKGDGRVALDGYVFSNAKLLFVSCTLFGS